MNKYLITFAFMFLAFHVDQTQGITKGLADGSLDLRLREIHTEHRMPIQADQFDAPSYEANKGEMSKLSQQSAREQFCKENPAQCKPKVK